MFALVLTLQSQTNVSGYIGHISLDVSTLPLMESYVAWIRAYSLGL